MRWGEWRPKGEGGHMLAHFCRARGRSVVFIGIIRCGPCSPLISPWHLFGHCIWPTGRIGSGRTGRDGDRIRSSQRICGLIGCRRQLCESPQANKWRLCDFSLYFDGTAQGVRLGTPTEKLAWKLWISKASCAMYCTTRLLRYVLCVISGICAVSARNRPDRLTLKGIVAFV